MNYIKNIALSAAVAGATILGANAQTKESTKDLDNRVSVIKGDTSKLLTTSQIDTTILQPYFLIKDLTLSKKDASKSYRIDMNKSKLHPDTENKFIPYVSFEVFADDVRKGIVKPSQISGQTLDNLALVDIQRNNKLYKMGEFYGQGNCPSDCQINPAEKALLTYASSLFNKYSTVCTDLSTQELKSLNGIITAEESKILQEKARNVIMQYPGKTGVVFGVKQLNDGHSYLTSSNVRGYAKPETKGLAVAIIPNNNTTKKIEFNESELIMHDNFETEKIPCTGPGCDDNVKSKAKGRAKKTSIGMYVTPSVGYNTDLEIIVPNAAIGLNVGKFSIGINGGYASQDKTENTYFPGVNGGYTSIDSTQNTLIKQLGLEASVALFNGKIKPFLGVQNNIVSQKNAGTVEQKVFDGAGNSAYQKMNLAENSSENDYLTLNPGIGIKISDAIDVFLQIKYNQNKKEFQEYNAGLRINIGNYRR